MDQRRYDFCKSRRCPPGLSSPGSGTGSFRPVRPSGCRSVGHARFNHRRLACHTAAHRTVNGRRDGRMTGGRRGRAVNVRPARTDGRRTGEPSTIDDGRAGRQAGLTGTPSTTYRRAGGRERGRAGWLVNGRAGECTGGRTGSPSTTDVAGDRLGDN